MHKYIANEMYIDEPRLNNFSFNEMFNGTGVGSYIQCTFTAASFMKFLATSLQIAGTVKTQRTCFASNDLQDL